MKMFKQQIANISLELLSQLIHREFPEEAEVVKSKLMLVDSDSEPGRRRISAAILKLADRDFSKLDSLIEKANTDYRDIIAAAEYPRVFKAGFSGLTDEEGSRASEADWNEYQDWLNKGKT